MVEAYERLIAVAGQRSVQEPRPVQAPNGVPVVAGSRSTVIRMGEPS